MIQLVSHFHLPPIRRTCPYCFALVLSGGDALAYGGIVNFRPTAWSIFIRPKKSVISRSLYFSPNSVRNFVTFVKFQVPYMQSFEFLETKNGSPNALRLNWRRNLKKIAPNASLVGGNSPFLAKRSTVYGAHYAFPRFLRNVCQALKRPARVLHVLFRPTWFLGNLNYVLWNVLRISYSLLGAPRYRYPFSPMGGVRISLKPDEIQGQEKKQAQGEDGNIGFPNICLSTLRANLAP